MKRLLLPFFFLGCLSSAQAASPSKSTPVNKPPSVMKFIMPKANRPPVVTAFDARRTAPITRLDGQAKKALKFNIKIEDPDVAKAHSRTHQVLCAGVVVSGKLVAECPTGISVGLVHANFAHVSINLANALEGSLRFLIKDNNLTVPMDLPVTFISNLIPPTLSVLRNNSPVKGAISSGKGKVISD